MTKVKKVRQKYTLFTGKALFFLILPIVVEAALSMSLGLVDSFMVKDIGNLGKAMGAVSNVDQISNLIIQLFSAFGAGGAILTSQYLGAGKVDDANRSAKQLIVLMLSLSLIVMTLSLVLNHQIVNLFFGDMDEEYLSHAYTYFYFMAASYPFLAIFNSSAAILRAQRKSMNTMISGAISFLINVVFNAIFIYAANWGIAGAAGATLIARIFPAVFCFCLLARKSNLVRVKVFERFRFNGHMLKNIARLGVPSGIENSLFQLGKLLTASFIAISIYYIPELDTNIQVTANSLAMQINSISSIVGNGINTSILTVVGQAVGRGDIAQVKYYIRKMLLISYIGNACCVGLTMGMSPLLIGVFSNNITPETAQIAQNCLWLCLSVQFATYPLSFGLPAVLKANSDMKYVMFSAIASMAIFRVGLCYILTCEWAGAHLGAMGLWIGMVADWGARSLLFGGRVLSGRWKKSSGMLKDEADAASEVETAEPQNDLSAETAETPEALETAENIPAENIEAGENNSTENSQNGEKDADKEQ